MEIYTPMNKFYLIVHYTLFTIIFFTNSVSAQEAKIDSFLPDRIITDLKSDGVELWVTTEGDGIYKYNKLKDKWTNYSSENKKIKQDFFYCIEINPRFIWAGSAEGLYIFDRRRNRWAKRKFALGGQFGNWIRSLKYDRTQNILWIGRFKFLTEYNLRTHKYHDIDLTVNKNNLTNTVKTIAEDGDSVLWIGVEAGVHKIIKNENEKNHAFKIQYFNNTDDFFMGEGKQVSISKILPDNDYIWFGTDEFKTQENPEFNVGGLFRFDRKINWIKFDEFNKLNANGIFSLVKTGNYIWTSVYTFDPQSKNSIGKGIFIINRKTLDVTKVNSKVIPETVLSMFFDGKYIWLGTNNGLYRISLVNNFITDF